MERVDEDDAPMDPFAVLPVELVHMIVKWLVAAECYVDAVAVCGASPCVRSACDDGSRVCWARFCPRPIDSLLADKSDDDNVDAPPHLSLVDVAMAAAKDDATKRRALYALCTCVFGIDHIKATLGPLASVDALESLVTDALVTSTSDDDRSTAVDGVLSFLEAGNFSVQIECIDVRSDKGTTPPHVDRVDDEIVRVEEPDPDDRVDDDDDDDDGDDDDENDDSNHSGDDLPEDLILISDVHHAYGLKGVAPIHIGVGASLLSEDFMRAMAPRSPRALDPISAYIYSVRHGPYKVIPPSTLTLDRCEPLHAVGLRAAIDAHLTRSLAALIDDIPWLARVPVDLFAAYPATQVFFECADGNLGNYVIEGHVAPLVIVPSLPAVGAERRLGAKPLPFPLFLGALGAETDDQGGGGGGSDMAGPSDCAGSLS